MLVSLSNKVFTRLETDNALIEEAESTINYALVNHNGIKKRYVKVPLTGGGGNAKVRKSYWGALKMLQYEVSFKGDTIKEALFIEDEVSDSTVLFLSRNDKHFFLGGKSIIEGDVKVPFKEIANLNLSGYEGSFIHKRGNIKEAINELPTPREFHTKENTVNISEERIYNEKINSFFSKTKKTRFSANTVENLNLSGNYIIESENKILLKNNNKLNDVIVIGATVELEEGFKGAIQIYATEKIIINKNVELQYPSVVYLEGSNKDVEIKIGKGSEISGLIVGVSDRKEDSKVIVLENSSIYGDLYCSGEVEFKGEMYGGMYVREFYLKTEESEYQNALLDFKLFKLPKFFYRINAIGVNDSLCEVIKKVR
ncbi:hypothetical protein [Tenacibaculum sp.]|uniref:hypothetical protein n=1 Tax=Tenacibaculum sp. TaxID=1906242 RepID=UPI003D118722